MAYSLFLVELDIKGILWKIDKKEKVFTNIKTEINIVGIGRQIKDMEKEYLHGKMGINILVILLMILK